MKKRFIILIDFSETSKNLLRFAFEWNKQVNARIILLHQTTILVPVMTDYEIKKEQVQNAKSEALKKLKSFSKELIPVGRKVSYIITEKSLTSRIQDLSEETSNDLIFVGLKGTGIMKRIFIGSVAAKVLESTRSTVVAIPKELHSFKHKNIFIAVADRHLLNLLEFNKYLEFIDYENTNLTFFYLAKPNERTKVMEEKLQALANLFSDKFSVKYMILETKSSVTGLKKVINSKTCQFLVVQRSTKYLHDFYMRKFLINELVYDGKIPLIVLP